MQAWAPVAMRMAEATMDFILKMFERLVVGWMMLLMSIVVGCWIVMVLDDVSSVLTLEGLDLLYIICLKNDASSSTLPRIVADGSSEPTTVFVAGHAVGRTCQDASLTTNRAAEATILSILLRNWTCMHVNAFLSFVFDLADYSFNLSSLPFSGLGDLKEGEDHASGERSTVIWQSGV